MWRLISGSAAIGGGTAPGIGGGTAAGALLLFSTANSGGQYEPSVSLWRRMLLLRSVFLLLVFRNFS